MATLVGEMREVEGEIWRVRARMGRMGEGEAEDGGFVELDRGVMAVNGRS